MALCPFPPESCLGLGRHVRQKRPSQGDHGVSYCEKKMFFHVSHFAHHLWEPLPALPGPISSTCDSHNPQTPLPICVSSIIFLVQLPRWAALEEGLGVQREEYIYYLWCFVSAVADMGLGSVSAKPKWRDPQTGLGRGRPSLGSPKPCIPGRILSPIEAEGLCYTHCFAKFLLQDSERGKLCLQPHLLHRQESMQSE